MMGTFGAEFIYSGKQRKKKKEPASKEVARNLLAKKKKNGFLPSLPSNN